jgi:hypothetical protein
MLSDMEKDDYLTSFSALILLFTAMIDWNMYTWLGLLAILVLVSGWYFLK